MSAEHSSGKVNPDAREDQSVAESRGVGRWLSAKLAQLVMLPVAIATLGAVFASTHWFCDLLVHFRVQYFLVLCVCGLLLLLARSWKSLAICLLCLVINGSPLMPYWFGGRTDRQLVAENRVFRVVCQNVLTSNRQAEALKSLIREQRPDFVFLLEINSRWQRDLQELSEMYPHCKFVPDDRGNFGIAVLSKHEWVSLSVVRPQPTALASFDIEFELPTRQGETSEAATKTLQIVATHPLPPVGAANTASRDKHLAEMAEVVRQDCPSIMLGDFNQTPWSPRFKEVLKSTRMSDSAMGFGVIPTWHVFPLPLAGIKIDHILINESIRVLNHKVLEPIGSDHRGVQIDFQFSD